MTSGEVPPGAMPPGAMPPGEPRDPGLQPERTYLAWQRTLILLIVVAVLSAAAIIDVAPAASRLLALLPLVLAAGATSVLGLAVRQRWHSAAPGSRQLTRARPWQVALLSVVVGGLAVVVGVAALV